MPQDLGYTASRSQLSGEGVGERRGPSKGPLCPDHFRLLGSLHAAPEGPVAAVLLEAVLVPAPHRQLSPSTRASGPSGPDVTDHLPTALPLSAQTCGGQGPRFHLSHKVAEAGEPEEGLSLQATAAGGTRGLGSAGCPFPAEDCSAPGQAMGWPRLPFPPGCPSLPSFQLCSCHLAGPEGELCPVLSSPGSLSIFESLMMADGRLGEGLLVTFCNW